MATAIPTTAISFNPAGTAVVGPPSIGHAWQITIGVPSASATNGFQILPGYTTMGNAVGTIQGQGTVGPFHLAGGSVLTVQVISGAVPNGPVQVQGWDFNLAKEPPGQIFVQNSGGTTTTVPAKNTPVVTTVSVSSAAATVASGIGPISPWPNNHLWVFWGANTDALVIALAQSAAGALLNGIVGQLPASSGGIDLGAIFFPTGWDVYLRLASGAVAGTAYLTAY
jgi:hypothetical protein